MSIPRNPSRFPLRSPAAHAFLALLCVAAPKPVRAQDVELFGYIHGTRPPTGYFEQLRRDPDSFRFRVEGPDRMEQARLEMRGGAGGIGFRPGVFGGAGAPGALPGGPASTLGPRGPVTGAYSFPLVLGLFSDGTTSPAFTREAIQTEFFDGPNSYGATLPEFYGEMSGGMVQLVGTTFPWVQSGMTRAQVTLGDSGLRSDYSQGVGAFIEAIVTALDQSGVDWGPFDGNGDGYVDVLTVIHPTSGAECTQGATNLIWSHRWNLADATNSRLSAGATGNVRDGVRTSTPAANGDYIYVNDYTIQPLLTCDGEDINEIGTFAHEMGHAFGLPDLYRTYSSSFYAGAGNWDLMATGGWGCRGNLPQDPCHMGAWSKAMLGWVGVEEVPPGTDDVVTLEPVETGQRVLKLPAQDGSNEYVLIENRERIGSDGALYEPGLLIWQINDDVLAGAWASNTVNNDPTRMGVWLRQADGRDDLLSTIGGRGDPGDVFPGCIKPSPFDYGDPGVPCAQNTEFRAGKAPEAVSRQGKGLGTTVLDIELLGAEPHDVRFRVNTQMATVTVASEREGVPTSVAGFALDGVPHSFTPFQFLSAPFESHELTAAGGIPTTPGTRISFLEWADGGPRAKQVTTGFSDQTYLARYQNEEIRLRVTTNEPAEGVAPATFTADPGAREPEGDDFWFPQGTIVSVLATPRKGFAFRDWVGVDSPDTNPATITLDGPTEIQANFDLTYALVAIPSSLQIEAAAPQQISLEVLEGNDPVTWSLETGALPTGLSLGGSTGVITGIATELGHFEAGVLARDAIGLEARGVLDMDVNPPNVGIQQLVSGFVDSQELLTVPQLQFFDQEGNANGSYDVGDFRAYLQAHPDLPEMESSGAAQPAPITVRLGSFEPSGDGGGGAGEGGGR